MTSSTPSQSSAHTSVHLPHSLWSKGLGALPGKAGMHAWRWVEERGRVESAGDRRQQGRRKPPMSDEIQLFWPDADFKMAKPMASTSGLKQFERNGRAGAGRFSEGFGLKCSEILHITAISWNSRAPKRADEQVMCAECRNTECNRERE